MESEPDIPMPRIAAFVRQHTHDLRNGLNSLDLEAALLREIVADPEAQASIGRIIAQLRALAEQLRSLSAVFQKPSPVVAPIAAGELLLIWKEKHAALPEPPAVHWESSTGEEKVEADVEMMAAVFRELLVNAASFSTGEKLTAAARVENGEVIFELTEPKRSQVDTSRWGEPFATTRPGGYGLGLWAARRLMEAQGAKLTQQYLAGDEALVTRIALPRL